MNNIGISLIFLLLLCCSNSDKKDDSLDDPEHQGKEAKLNSDEYQNPVFEAVLADPSIIQNPDNKKFYVYATEVDWADDKGNRLVPILKSEDLVDWKNAGNAFDSKPNWKQDGGIWAPDINRVGDQYFLYYAFSTWGDENPGIGLAIAENPGGPFLDQGKLFDSQDMDVPNSIDPFYYSDGENHYIFWGSYSDTPTQGTYAIELSEDSKKVKKDAQKTKVAAGDFEAVMIHKHENYYYFFGSKGSFSTYHVLVARSEDLTGPYKDKDGCDIAERDHGSLLVEGDTNFIGPGHTSNIVSDNKNNDWILYHAIDPEHDELSNGTPRRVLMLDALEWEDGWPAINRHKPSSSPVKKPDL